MLQCIGRTLGENPASLDSFDFTTSVSSERAKLNIHNFLPKLFRFNCVKAVEETPDGAL